MSTYAGWFATLSRNIGFQLDLEIDRMPAIGKSGYDLWLRIDGPFPTRKGAELALEHARREIADLIATAPGVIEDHAHREDEGMSDAELLRARAAEATLPREVRKAHRDDGP